MSTDLKERKPNRWKGFDYSSENAYFITICVDKKLCLLGEVVDNKIHLNEYGRIVEQCWNDLPNHYPNCILDSFTIMPNHIHGIIVIDNFVFKPANAAPVGNGLKPFPTRKHGLSEMIRALKTFSSRRINEKKSSPDNISTPDIVGNGFKRFPTNTPANNIVGNGFKPFLVNTPPNDNVGNGFKPFPTNNPERFKWQKSFHDHIIRDFKALENIRNYIYTNPANWEKDVFFMNINFTL